MEATLRGQIANQRKIAQASLRQAAAILAPTAGLEEPPAPRADRPGGEASDQKAALAEIEAAIALDPRHQFQVVIDGVADRQKAARVRYKGLHGEVNGLIPTRQLFDDPKTEMPSEARLNWIHEHRGQELKVTVVQIDPVRFPEYPVTFAPTVPIPVPEAFAGVRDRPWQDLLKDPEAFRRAILDRPLPLKTTADRI
jgi:hypothetical protein